jgi:hypothetical protein
MNVPHQHPDQGEESTPTKRPPSVGTMIVIGAILVFVILMIALHVAGIAPHQ